ncbi:MAG: gamma-glutamylcyclotransferase [Acidobacteriota bacterium]
MQRLFVYGTLSPGRPNHHVVEKIAGTWEAATVQGVLVEEGWGAAFGSPGLVLRADGDEVHGYMLQSPELDEYLPMLDEFEGDEYRRVVGQVRGVNSGEVDAYLYVLSREV